MDKNRKVTIIYSIQSILALIPAFWVGLSIFMRTGYFQFSSSNIAFIFITVSVCACILFLLLFSQIIIYRQQGIMSSKKSALGILIFFLPLLVLMASYALSIPIHQKLQEKRGQRYQLLEPQKTTQTPKLLNTGTPTEKFAPENLSKSLTPKEDIITAQDAVIGKYIVYVRPSTQKAIAHSYKTEYYFTGPKDMISIAVPNEGVHLSSFAYIDGAFVYPFEIPIKDPHPESWTPVLVKDIITPDITQKYTFYPNHYFNSFDDVLHNKIYFSVFDTNLSKDIILYEYDTVSKTTKRIKVFTQNNVPHGAIISADERYFAFKIMDCWACEPSPKSTILFDTVTNNTKEIPYTSSFRWLENGAYEYTERIIDEAKCKDVPRYACDTIDPKNLPLKTGSLK